MGADGVVERHFPHAEADLRLEPLPALGDQVHDGDRRVQQAGSQEHEVVERLLGRRVENPVTIERAQAFGFVPRGGGHVPGHLQPEAFASSNRRGYGPRWPRPAYTGLRICVKD